MLRKITVLVGLALLGTSAAYGGWPGGGRFSPAAPTTATWDPATVTNSGVLSAGNLAFQFSGGSGNVVRSSRGTTAKVYYEITLTTCGCGAGYIGVGAIDNSQATATPTSAAAVTAKMWECRDDGGKINSGTFTGGSCSGFSTGAVISIAIDNSLGSGSGKIWWGVCSGGVITWNASGNPATGANAQFSNLTGTIMGWVNFFGSTGSPKITANFGGTSYACTAPAGFNKF